MAQGLLELLSLQQALMAQWLPQAPMAQGLLAREPERATMAQGLLPWAPTQIER